MKYITLLFIFLSLQDFSQNLIQNSDFESKSNCPTTLGQFYLTNGWASANSGTPDYFNDCSPSFNFGTEFNIKGGQIPHSGHGYIGIQINNLHHNLYFEYLETELISPLEPGKIYCIKMYLSLGNSDCAVRGMGAVISQNLIRSSDAGMLNLPFIKLENNQPLTDSISWMCVKGFYKATGNERFLTCGYFGNKEDFIRLRLNPKLDSSFYSAYYFIDDISLEAVKNNEDCNCQ